MNIDELINTVVRTQVLSENQNVAELSVSDQWAQGRTLFGGLSAGLAYVVCKPLVDDDRVLRSLTVNFVGPLMYDVPFQIKAVRLRSGKNVSQLSVQIVQQDNVSLIAQVCFGVARTSAVKVENTDTHGMPQPTKAKFIPQIPKITPRFLRNFDLSIQAGGVPFLNSKDAHYHGWMRFKQPPESITDVHLITLIDAWPPTLLQMLKWPAPASTVSWNIEFIHPHKPVEPTDWFAYQAHTRHAADGYGHTEANIWDASGSLVAISRQTVAIFD
ncbi:acyl-CoA thioesterase [Alteromonas oceanisediminis]|uniref:acyl-CoA thioesterase n=1 Tax=Alteromonas oceanisediminis TaxID=2836180 RepID=UPI001BD9186B|nr:thioesterase family protein [Alteromonas oceanisediminis]MBT0587253.1 thioesterase family protein [Alteromonas oceanisediminis]